MALVPESQMTSFFTKAPEMGVNDIESQIVNLLHESKYSDDAKAKLLSQLLLKYQRAINEPKPPLRVTIEDSKEQVQEESKRNTIEDPILRDILLSVPANFQKFIPPIVEKLNTRSYDWNKYGELTKDSEIIKNTNVIDLFSYLMRNVKKGHEPNGFSVFWRAIKGIKIPTRWIGNQKLVEMLGDDTILDEVQKEYTFETSERVNTSKTVSVTKAFESLLQQVKPKNIQSDKGNEFYNTQLQSLFKKYNINQYSAEGDAKSTIVERFNRTLKQKMFRVFTYRKSYKYDDVLQSLVKSYNNSKHLSIGMAPSKVTRELEPQIFKKLYGYYTIRNPQITLKEDDLVRISKGRTNLFNVDIYQVRAMKCLPWQRFIILIQPHISFRI
ncbi:uncharacterized transposon-derived protein F54H12.3 [Trichonephila clavata]|uniref:Uncharacterized transposon-derived protein F54H12.3 n=1 Tax=Trichonephila clavata TaxID=2740835 RepID=A0A8X6I7E9_TRICU|nr:uncharacterized transposon-derived protein F54H12.3 [Trichonephila clavata]